MKACWFEVFGAAQDVLQQGDWPTPEPGPGEVLVQLQTTGVNPSDVKKRAGAFPDLLESLTFCTAFTSSGSEATMSSMNSCRLTRSLATASMSLR